MEDIELRTLRIRHTLKAPIILVWEVWANPNHIINWWGPNGFTTTIHQMDMREGGEWKLTLHGPDDTNYANRSIFKEISIKEKICFEHFNPHFLTTVIFEAKGEETYLDWSMLFDTADMYQVVAKTHKAEEGLKQNVEKLEVYLSNIIAGLEKR